MLKNIFLLGILGINLTFTPLALAENLQADQNSDFKIEKNDKGEVKIKLKRGKIQKSKQDQDIEETKKDEEVKKLPEKHLEFGGVKENTPEVFSQSNFPEKLKNSTTDIDIITSDDLKLLKQNSLKDILNLYPEITMQDQGSIGNMSSIRIRGWDKVKLSLDGFSILNDIADGNKVYLNDLLPEGLERIEIIKGPQGTVNGVQTQGGLISMTSRKGFGAPAIEYQSGMGNFKTFKEDFSFQGGNPSADYFLGITRLDTAGGMRIPSENKIKHDDYGNLTVTNNLGKRLLEGKAEIRHTFRLINSRKDVGLNDNSLSQISESKFDPNDKRNQIDIFDSISFNHALTNWYDYNLKWGFYKTRYKSFNLADEKTDIYTDNYCRKTDTKLMFSTQHNLKFKDINTFSVGYNLEYDNFDLTSSYNNSLPEYEYHSDSVFAKDQALNSVYFHDVINIKDTLILRGGTRITNNSDWGTYAMPNVSGALIFPTFKIPQSYTKIRSSYGFSVNTPTMTQLSFTDWGGNPDLKPEKVNGWDIAMEQSFLKDKVNLNFGYFKNDYKDLIQWVANGPNWWDGGDLKNFNKAKTSGWESALTLKPLPGLKATVNYTYTTAKTLSYGQYVELQAVPRNRWNYLISYSPNYKYDVYCKASISSSRKYNTFVNERLKGFFDTSIGANIFLFKLQDANVYLSGQLNNVLNQKYQVYKSYRHPGISFMAGIFIRKAF